MLKRRLLFGLALLLLFGGVWIATSRNRLDDRAVSGQNTSQQGNAESRKPLALPLTRPRIVIRKSARILELYSEGTLVRSYRAGLGLSPVEDKAEEGDRRTPEGEFYIFTKNPRSSFYLSLGLSYPNIEDAQRGLRDGLVSKSEHDAIAEAIKRKKMPPQNTRLGGEIYIHGRGSATDWTWGCIALDDADMKELFDSVPAGTTVVIEH